ncbi:hypothetical protein QJQ45_008558 [Haematococcus lacustris]|nr:hypothetical protein QJQ45_008558 [Haematococcus lacustris]
MHVQGTVFQQPTYKAYPGKVFKQGQEAQCRNEALAAGLTVYQLPQDVLPVLEVVMAIIYITRVYCSLIFSSVRPQQTPKQRTEYITQYGTGQRLQVLLAKSPSGKLDLTFKTLNNADTKAINDQLTDAQKAEVQKHKEVLTKYFTRLLPVLVKLLDRPINALATIINDPVNKRKMVGEGDEQEMLIEPAQHAAPPQAPHTDFKPMASGLDDGFVFLLACQDFDLVAYMYSHLLMEHAAPYYKNGNPDLPSLTAIATHALLREGTLVQVKAGQLVLFRGNTVHAGTAGRQDSCGARLYGFGKTGQPADNTTVNMSQLGAVFEGVFRCEEAANFSELAAMSEWHTARIKRVKRVAYGETGALYATGLLDPRYHGRHTNSVLDTVLTANPCMWWQTYGHGFGVLRDVAMRLLSIPATSASTERVFSTFKHIWSDHRQSMLMGRMWMSSYIYFNRRALKGTRGQTRSSEEERAEFEEWLQHQPNGISE